VRIDLNDPKLTLNPMLGLALVCSVYRWVLYGPEVLLVRSNSLTAIMEAKNRVLATMPLQVRQEHRGED
jgi:hypothetical protein